MSPAPTTPHPLRSGLVQRFTVANNTAQPVLPANLVAMAEELFWTLPGVHSVGTVFDTHEQPMAIQVFCDPDLSRDQIDSILAQLKTLGNTPNQSPHAITLSVTDHTLVMPEDRAESWKRFWKPTPITDRLVICPSWEPFTPAEGQQVIQLDPGCAFGTGTHPTTQLMLQAMEPLADTINFGGISLLDVGTGSGILAIYAALRGCRNVMALDNDPLAVQATEANATANNVSHAITADDTPLGELCRTKVEVILANIIAPVILELLDDMLLRLAPKGHLLLSGLIDASVNDVAQAVEASGLTITNRRHHEGWWVLEAKAL
jgi:ribosomal protein L11 methyltransferase